MKYSTLKRCLCGDRDWSVQKEKVTDFNFWMQTLWSRVLWLLQLSLLLKADDGLSNSCSNAQVVPGSLYDYAYVYGGMGKPWDPSWCQQNIHPNSTYPVARDTAMTISYISVNDQNWCWAGIRRLSTNGLKASTTFLWFDGVDTIARNVGWRIGDPQDSPNDCAGMRSDGNLESILCTGTRCVICEIGSTFLQLSNLFLNSS
jgi:hypothetical protein